MTQRSRRSLLRLGSNRLGRTASNRRVLVGLLIPLLAATIGVSWALGALVLGRGPSVTIVLVGDIMFGRGVAPIVAGDPSGIFEEVRSVLRRPDLALANLESPLTPRTRSPDPYALEADPAAAHLLANAGFDVMSLANNHIGDGGPESIENTIAAVDSVGMLAVGAGTSSTRALAPLMIDLSGVRVAVLSFDATGAGLVAGTDSGVAAWGEESAREAVEAASARSDLLVVSLHGGVEYLPEADPRMLALAEQLSSWGADVVWGHGAHVVQPVFAGEASGERSAVIATSLGNFLFDQRGPLTGQGAVLEVLADRAGVIAYRIGSTSHADLRVRFVAWQLPVVDAALVDGEWWSLVREVGRPPQLSTSIGDFEWGTVVAASTGRVTGGDRWETVVSFRHSPGPHPVRDGLPEVQWVDVSGRSAHLGIYRADDLAPVWVAGVVPAPVAEVAACDGSVALAYSGLDDPSVFATGAAVWQPFGLNAVDLLPGEGTPSCLDVDGDGVTEPVVLERP